MNNTAAMYYINRQGGACSPALCQEAICLWNLTMRHKIHIMDSYFLGIENAAMDRLSRSFLPHHEWSLHPETANMIFQKWGALQLNLFASQLNKKCR